MILQLPLNNLNNSSFGVFGGPMAHATWAERLVHGSLRVLKYPYCHQMTPLTHPKCDGQVLEPVEL